MKEQDKKLKLELESKELAEALKNNIITENIAKKIEKITISLKDNNLENLKKDLAEICKYYPNVLKNIEFKNSTNTPINVQKLIDCLYKTSNKRTINITISSKFTEDFDLNLSSGNLKRKFTLKNISEDTIELPSLKGKIHKNIIELSIEGFDVSKLDIEDSKLKKIIIKSLLTKNIDSINGLKEVPIIEIEKISDIEFENYYNNIFSKNSKVTELIINMQNFHNRKILRDLAINPNLTEIMILSSKVNDLDGLELFDGRLGALGLWSNNIEIKDLEKIYKFKRNNIFTQISIGEEYNIKDAIKNAPEISDESYKLISKLVYSNGRFKLPYDNKKGILDKLLWNLFNVPYYIKDAQILRGMVGITENPMILENDNEIYTIDFNQNYLQGGTLLLTIPQIEKLLLSDKIIPQNIRINIHDVSELSVEKAKKLYKELQNKKMNLSGVQIFDENADNTETHFEPYSLSEYVYIRDTLDIIVSDIDKTEPDIDKFATVYQRLMDSIEYDELATEYNKTTYPIYYGKKRRTSRNLLEGLEEGKCVCSGYADILRNALSLVDIESRINVGKNKANDSNSAHAWNQVRIDDGTGNKKWYYTDLTWDAGYNNNDYTLLGKENFTNQKHELTYTQDIEHVEKDDYDRKILENAFQRAKNRSFNFIEYTKINIPEDSNIELEILDKDRINREYQNRKKDMYAKYYGNKEYEKEYKKRNLRYRDYEDTYIKNEKTIVTTVDEYPEREDDERFLYLDQYRACIERISKYESGDTSVYKGTPSQIQEKLKKDKEYVETRNHTFNQNKSTMKDLATLGKYGETVPYFPKQQGILKNIGRILLNIGIFTRNMVTPIYKGIGKYIAQPIHKLIVGDEDPSPYKNNFYHRMVARREYFEEINSIKNPDHPVINSIKSKIDAIFKSKEGNEAVLRAGDFDIRENIINEEKQRILINNLTKRSHQLRKQINQLNEEIKNKPHAQNISLAKAILQKKIYEIKEINTQIEINNYNEIGRTQSDAISDEQHLIASKEVNTIKTTVIKGVIKGLTIGYIGPKIEDWLLEKGKTINYIQRKLYTTDSAFDVIENVRKTNTNYNKKITTKNKARENTKQIPKTKEENEERY